MKIADTGNGVTIFEHSRRDGAGRLHAGGVRI
jgi:hypothetical protein